MVDGGWWMVDGGWWMVDGGRVDGEPLFHEPTQTTMVDG